MRQWQLLRQGGELEKTNSYRSYEERIKTLLFDAIKLRLRSDVEWGPTLSWGFDSSSIIYAANALINNQKQIHAFSAVFPGLSEMNLHLSST